MLSRLFLSLTIAFIGFVIIGTLTHESGHIIVAKSLGYKTTLHYASMDWDSEKRFELLNDIHNKYTYEIINNLDFPQKKVYEKELSKRKKDQLLIISGGVLTSILIGTIGFIFLLFRRKKFINKNLMLIDWLLILTSLFWLRTPFNLCYSFIQRIVLNNSESFRMDEEKLNRILSLPHGFINIVLSVIGISILTCILFKVIPSDKRFLFLLSAFIGSISGFILWMKIGPHILP